MQLTPTRPTGWILAVAAPILVACEAMPSDPTGALVAAGIEARAVESAPPPLLILTAPGQLVTLEGAERESERAWVQAHLVVRDLSGRGGSAQMDGAILVVSAADGPMPQTSSVATWLSIDIDAGAVGSDGVLRFEGVARLRDATREAGPFEIAGSAQQHAGHPDCIIWDILGSSVYDHATFETEAVILDLAGIFGSS